jgi:hypothetical protein
LKQSSIISIALALIIATVAVVWICYASFKDSVMAFDSTNSPAKLVPSPVAAPVAMPVPVRVQPPVAVPTKAPPVYRPPPVYAPPVTPVYGPTQPPPPDG